MACSWAAASARTLRCSISPAAWTRCCGQRSIDGVPRATVAALRQMESPAMSRRADRVSRAFAAAEIVLLLVPLAALLCLVPVAVLSNAEEALAQLGMQGSAVLLGSFLLLVLYAAFTLYAGFRMLATYAIRGAPALDTLPPYLVHVGDVAVVVVLCCVAALLLQVHWPEALVRAPWIELHMRLLSAGLPLVLPWAHLKFVMRTVGAGRGT